MEYMDTQSTNATNVTQQDVSAGEAMPPVQAPASMWHTWCLIAGIVVVIVIIAGAILLASPWGVTAPTLDTLDTSPTQSSTAVSAEADAVLEDLQGIETGGLTTELDSMEKELAQ